MASPTFPIPASSWAAWSRPVIQYQGLSYISGSDPLFVHQYSHAWFDFRAKKDVFANYFQNSITATQAHRLFCLSLSRQILDYSADLWGICVSVLPTPSSPSATQRRQFTRYPHLHRQ